MPQTRHTPPEPESRFAHAADTAREGLQDAAERTVHIIEENPIAVLAGGLAVGALVAALIPKSRREMRLLAPVGRQLTDRAKGAIETAKDTAKEQLGIAGISRDNAKTQGNALAEAALKALASAGMAALQQAGAAGRRGPAND